MQNDSKTQTGSIDNEQQSTAMRAARLLWKGIGYTVWTVSVLYLAFMAFVALVLVGAIDISDDESEEADA